MNIRFFIFFGLLFLGSNHSFGLTVKQFSDICKSSSEECSEQMILQAYIGGALDLVATLDEETDYLDRLYCKPPEELFDVSSIIRFMRARSEGYADQNAMILVVQYFEENGGCSLHE